MSRTIKQALQESDILSAVSETPLLDAQLLLAHVLQKSREYLFTWPEEMIQEDSDIAYKELIARRRNSEPVAYLVGHQSFWDFELDVNPAVLIPRPETELLVEKSLALFSASKNESIAAVDLGTGSGAIAIALAKEKPRWNLTAIDLSSEALAVAKANAQKLAVDFITFIEGSWLQPVASKNFDLIIANPPYVEEGDSHLLEGSLPHEPMMALISDNQGLSDIETIIQQGKNCLKLNGWLLLEHGFDQAEKVREIFSRENYLNVESEKDIAGIERITFAQWSGNS